MLAVLAYFPIFGWFFPMFLKGKDEFCQFHAKQGLGAVVFFLITFISAWLIGNATPYFLRYVEWGLLILAAVLYILILFIGFLTAIRGKKKPIPFIGKKADNWPL